MKKETYDFIFATLQSSLDQLIATKLYLDHQLSLKPEHRVMEQTQGVAENNLYIIKLQILEHECTIRDFTQNKPNLY